MFENVPLLKSFAWQNFEDDSNTWLYFQTILDFLRKNHNDTDTIKEIKRHNLLRELKACKNGIREVNSDLYVNLTAFTRFIFHHCDQLKICFDIAHQIEAAMHSKAKRQQPIQVLSIKELYKNIVKTTTRLQTIENVLMKDMEMNERSTACLYTQYRDDFTDKEWYKIVMFEYHFSKEMPDAEFQDYEQLMQLKWEYLQHIQYTTDMAKSILKSSKEVIKHRTERKLLAKNEQELMFLYANRIHISTKIETELCNATSEDIENVLVFDCLSSCSHPPSIHIFAEIKSEQQFHMSDVISIFKVHSENKHDLFIHSVVFMKPNSITHFLDANNMSRFDLRDLFLMNKIDETVIIEKIVNVRQERQFEDQNEKCDRCFKETLLKPLHWNTFQALKEWDMDVPLDIQILLESFLNESSLIRSSEEERLVHSKITKLYGIYDTLLNIYNRNYCGIIQELNTQELAMNYQSIGTAFSVSSSSGATLSLNAAEKKIKENASSELCYYNTYIRKYELEYKTVAGVTKNFVSLRNCLLIVMLDNLVRLKHHADPIPGESRSMQMCTLPITLKGVPEDHIDVQQTWHTDQRCDQSGNCKCKDDIALTKEDVSTTMLSLTEQEGECMNKFGQMMTWGLHDLWKKIITEEKHLLESDLDNGPETAGNSLEESFAALELEEQQGVVDNDKDGTETDGVMEMDFSDEEYEDVEDVRSEDMGSNHSSVDDDNDTVEEFEENLEDMLNEMELSNIPDSEFEDLDQYFTPLEDSVDLTPIPESKTYEQSKDITENQEDRLSLEDDQPESENQEDSLNQTDNTTHVGKLNDKIGENFGFKQYHPPTILTRHPPPATGRDDDIVKLKEILDDILIKADKTNSRYKILFGADNKIGANLIKLRRTSPKYQIFIPEYPVLHLKKSKVTNVCSAYKNAGILQILMYMRDEEYKEWKKLISAEHIEKAARYIRRLAIALRISFLIKFIQTLDENRKDKILTDLQKENPDWQDWETQFDAFLTESKAANATFLLHYEMMEHCEEITAISLAERLGGITGYSLMLASVKRSLPFAFLNGASSYAAYTTQLLYEHSKSGAFYTNLKASLFSLPHKDSLLNFGLDTQREMDHRDALKAFRSGATMSSVIPRMSLIDSLNEAHERSLRTKNVSTQNQIMTDNVLGLAITETDFNYIMRITTLILRQGGLSTTKDKRTMNVYCHPTIVLPDAILDSNTREVGHFLIWKYLISEGLYSLTKDDTPNLDQIQGPTEVLRKVKASKSTTIQRVGKILKEMPQKERDKKEVERKKIVAKQTKLADQKSSEMNACQAILKPDCSKPKVQKSVGIQRALMLVLKQAIEKLVESGNSPINTDELIMLKQKKLPAYITNLTTHVTVEFAGVKFKTRVREGKHYLKFVEETIINRTLTLMPNVKQMVICEEKYSFTPDHFKAATRSQRQVSKPTFSISHLKTSEEILSSEKFDKTSIVATMEGKCLISTYLARNIEQLKFKRDIIVDVDSELLLEHSEDCPLDVQCECQKYTTPLRYSFDSSPLSNSKVEKLTEITQCKGEAEMAQVDWLMEYVSKLDKDAACTSIVTSGDIDAVTVHMFALCHLWPRTEDNKFEHPVYVILHKPGNSMDIYNITSIIELLERTWNDPYIGIKIAIYLCLGGNDFLPKFYNISHLNVISTILASEYFLQHLVKIEEQSGQQKVLDVKFSQEAYIELIKTLYCPKSFDATILSFDEVRQLTVRPPTAKANDAPRNYALWMPAASVLSRLSLNIICFIKYYLGAGQHAAKMPNFLEEGCLSKTKTGEIEYCLGNEAAVNSENDILTIPFKDLAAKLKNCQLVRKKRTQTKGATKRKQQETPQKGARKKVQQTSTPKKH